MPQSPPILWLIQFGVLLLWGMTWFLFPATCLSILAGVPAEQLTSPAIDQLRMSAPYLIGLGGFSLFAMMTRRTRMKRGMSTVFTIVFGLWGLLNLQGIAAGYYSVAAVPFAMIPLFLALGNLGQALPKPPHWAVAEDAGDSATKPASAFAFWLLQFSILFFGALGFLLMPREVLSMISGNEAAALSDIAVHQTALLGAISIGMGLMSLLAVLNHSGFAWRGFAFFFAVFFSFWAVSIGWILVWGDYAIPVLSVLAPGLVFLPMNIWIFNMRGEFDPGDVQRFSESWTPLDLWAGPLMAFSVLKTKRRASHLVGVAARGVFKPSDLLAPPEKFPERETGPVPPNEFFVKADRDVVVRFANLTHLDDAALDVRGCAVRFAQEDSTSPFDLLMNTGSYCPAETIIDFAVFVLSKYLPKRIVEQGSRKNLIAREGAVAGLRRSPESFAGLNYYGQLVRYWSEPDGRRHLVRYRCLADEEAFPEECGLPTPQDASHVWLRDRLRSNDLPSDFLRHDLKQRLEGDEPIRMRIEAQFHHPTPGGSEEWFNPAVDWDEENHPWQLLGTLELTEALEDAEAEVLRFNPGQHPECLGIPSSTGPFGYRSMGDSEPRVVRTTQRLRSWMYGEFGLPAFGRVSER